MRGILIMKTTKSPIRAVAFDYGGVLAYFIDKESIAKMAEVAAVDYASFDTALWKFRQELDSGEYNNTSYWTAVLDHCGSPAPRESIIGVLVEMDLKGFSRMNQQLIVWAKTLKELGFTTLIISNMAKPTYQGLIAHQSWVQYFDVHIISGIIGINKPDQRIFQYAMDSLNLKGTEILFIDDLPHNVEGANKAGLQALVFSNTQALAEDLRSSHPTLPLKGLV